MSKFRNNLTANVKQIKEQRAKLLESSTKAAQEDLIRKLESEDRVLEDRLMNLEDLAPDSITSLKVGGADFNATEWVEAVQDVKIKRTEIAIKLEIAKKSLEEYFEDAEA